MYTLFLGIDPGRSGGLALLRGDGVLVQWQPLKGDGYGVFEQLAALPDRARIFAMVEAVHSSPQMGVRSAFTFGRSVGEIEAALAALAIARDDVTPQKWQAALGCLTRGDKGVTKRAAMALAEARGVRLKVTHRIADAYLLAEYGRRLMAHV